MSTDTPKAPKPALAALLAMTLTADGGEYYTVLCPACNADLSAQSLGRIRETVAGPVVDIFHPLRCGSCNQRLLPGVKVSPIARPRRPIT
jgi:hypothetical protein